MERDGGKSTDARFEFSAFFPFEFVSDFVLRISDFHFYS